MGNVDKERMQIIRDFFRNHPDAAKEFVKKAKMVINAFFYDNKFNLVFANNEQIIIYELNNSVFELKKSMNITNIKSVSVIANVFFIENDSDYLVYDFNTDNLLVLNALKLTYTKSVVNNVVLFACVDKQNNLIIFQK